MAESRFRSTLRRIFTRQEGYSEAEIVTMLRVGQQDLYKGLGLTGAVNVPIISFDAPSGTGAGAALRTNPLMFSPAWRISLRMGSLPIKVYRIDPATGEKAEAMDHLAYALFRKPNPVLTRNLLVSASVYSMFQYGRVGWLKVRKGVKAPPLELWPIPGNVLFPKRDQKAILSGYELRLSGAIVPLKLEDVCYFRLMPDPDDWAAGMSPMSSLGLLSDYGSEALGASTDYFRNALLSRHWIDMQGKVLAPAGRARLQSQMEIARRDRYVAPILEDGAYLRDMGRGPDGTILTDAITHSRDYIAETFGLPADPTNLPYYYGEVIQPIADAMEQEFERSIMAEYTSDPAFAEFQFREILAGDPLQRAELHRIKILSAQETPDEARKEENRGPLAGGVGSHAFLPLNVETLENLEAGTGQRPPAGSKKGMGGSEGKGTHPSARPQNLISVGAGVTGSSSTSAMADESETHIRGVRVTHWSEARLRALHGQTEAARRKMQGILKEELKAIRFAMGTSIPGSKPHDLVFPTAGILASIVNQRNPEMSRMLRAFMDAVGEDAFANALDLWVASPDDEEPLSLQSPLPRPTRERPKPPEALGGSYDQRTVQVADAFGGDRARAVEDALKAERAKPDGAVPGLERDLSARYDTFSQRLGNIAATELSWAHEQAAVGAWLGAGYRHFDFVYEGGPCTTGVCEAATETDHFFGDEVDNVGGSFTGAAYPPLHPGCNCFVVPSRGATT